MTNTSDHVTHNQPACENGPLTPSKEVQDAAALLLEHMVIYSLIDRLGDDAANAFIAELSLIADGKAVHGFLIGD